MGLLHWLAGGLLAGTVSVWAGAAVLLLAYFTTRHRRNLMVLVCGIGLVCGLWRNQVYNSHLESRRWFGTVSEAPGLICAPADRRDGFTFLTICFDEPHTTVRAKASPYVTHDIGDWVRVSGSIIPPTTQDSSFDYAKYLERFLVFGTMKQPKITAIEAVRPTSLTLQLWQKLTGVRHGIERHINQTLPEPEASFLAGLLLGSRRLIPPDVLANLSRTGTTHIIAVSGANVVIIASFVLLAARYLTHNVRAAWWLSLVIIWGFVALTGLSAAAVRGATVASFSLWVKHVRRSMPIATILLIPAAISVMINPKVFNDLGWQLSYAAFFGIIVIAPKLKKWLEQHSILLPATFAETTAATLTTSPISWWNFHTLSISGLLVNPLILWLVPIATGVGAAAVALTSVTTIILVPLRTITTLVLRLILTIVHLGSFIPLTWGDGS